LLNLLYVAGNFDNIWSADGLHEIQHTCGRKNSTSMILPVYFLYIMLKKVYCTGNKYLKNRRTSLHKLGSRYFSIKFEK